MAISLDELALGALEGSAGPWTLAVGAGALAVMLAAGSARPIRRLAASGVVTAQRNGQLQLPGSMNMSISSWVGGVRQSWRDLVAEARAEYEASRKPAPLALNAGAPVVLKPENRAALPADERPALPSPGAEGTAPTAHGLTIPEPAAPEQASPQTDITASDADTNPESSARPRRDQRGRFVRRPSTSARNNGTRSE